MCIFVRVIRVEQLLLVLLILYFRKSIRLVETNPLLHTPGKLLAGMYHCRQQLIYFIMKQTSGKRRIMLLWKLSSWWQNKCCRWLNLQKEEGSSKLVCGKHFHNGINPFKCQLHKMVKQAQTICWLLPTNCVSVFDHFVGSALKGLS